MVKKELLHIYCVFLCETKGLELVKVVKSYRGFYCLVCRDKKDHSKYTRLIMRKGIVKRRENNLSEKDMKFTMLCIEG